MDGESSTIVIDLGLERGEPPSYAARQTPRNPWVPASLLALLLLVTAVASAAPGAAPLSSLFTLQVGPADGYAVTADGQLLAQSYGMLTAYGLDTGKLRWASATAPTYELPTAGGKVLVRPSTPGPDDPGTTAVDLVTGQPAWHRAGRIVTVAGSDTLLAVTPVRTLDNTSRRVEGDISAVDPRTGATLWTVPVPGTAVLLGLPGPGDATGRMLLVRGDRTAVIDDLTTGRELARTAVPGADYEPTNPVITPAAILLLHSGELSAYDPDSLRPLWTEPAPGVGALNSCGALVCLAGEHGGITAVDPSTGARLWAHLDWGAVRQVAHAYVAYDDQEAVHPVGVIDPATGRLLVDLHGWAPVDGSPGGADLIVARVSDDPDGRTMVAIAHPGAAVPQPLAALPAGVRDCVVAPARLVCRSTYGLLTVWAYGRKD